MYVKERRIAVVAAFAALAASASFAATLWYDGTNSKLWSDTSAW